MPGLFYRACGKDTQVICTHSHSFEEYQLDINGNTYLIRNCIFNILNKQLHWKHYIDLFNKGDFENGLCKDLRNLVRPGSVSTRPTPQVRKKVQSYSITVIVVFSSQFVRTVHSSPRNQPRKSDWRVPMY